MRPATGLEEMFPEADMSLQVGSGRIRFGDADAGDAVLEPGARSALGCGVHNDGGNLDDDVRARAESTPYQRARGQVGTEFRADAGAGRRTAAAPGTDCESRTSLSTLFTPARW